MKELDTTDDYNVIDAKESDYLFIQSSQIPASGKGLYTAIDIYKDEVISHFKGEVLSEKQIQYRVNKNQDQYFIAMLDGNILDSKKVNCFAKYANDAKGTANNIYKNNAKITIDELDNICLVATKKIKSSEEIFCGYGKKYWDKHG
jgi:hypothetical protein